LNPGCAKKVIKILLCAEGGCIYCASELIKLFVEKFLGYKNLAKELFKNTFGTDIELSIKEKNKSKPEHKVEVYGWDDGEIYFWDGEKERCISDEEKLYEHIVKIYEEYFKKQKG